MKHYFECCRKELDYEPQMCCDGYMCGCYGRPIEPPVCSEECYVKLYVDPKKVIKDES